MGSTLYFFGLGLAFNLIAMEDRVLLLFNGGRGEVCRVFEAVLLGMPVSDAKALLWRVFRMAALDASLLSGASLEKLASFLDQLIDLAEGRVYGAGAAGDGRLGDV